MRLKELSRLGLNLMTMTLSSFLQGKISTLIRVDRRTERSFIKVKGIMKQKKKRDKESWCKRAALFTKASFTGMYSRGMVVLCSRTETSMRGNFQKENQMDSESLPNKIANMKGNSRMDFAMVSAPSILLTDTNIKATF